MIEIISLNEREKWNKIISTFDQTDSYYTPNYVIPYRDNGEGEPILIYYNDEKLEMINVIIKRDIALIDKLKDKVKPNTYFDLITPYGYGGMIIKGEKKNIPDMLEKYGEWCYNNNLVSEFVRFHPLIDLDDRIYEYYNYLRLGPTITVNINDEETVWSNYSSNNRNTIRRAIRNGVEITNSNKREDFNEFKRLYLQTMKGLNADEYYLFSDKFYESLYENMKDDMLIFNATHDSKVIASSLIMFDKGNVHYHLSGTDYKYRRLNATNLLLDEVIKHSYKNGYKQLHLGGGLGSKEDSLFKFKRNFNPKSSTTFKIGRKIYNEKLYTKLSEISQFSDENFFPKYRG